ncbi:hypothetical protein CRM22_000665 [Opisthorchis felineus]|uniref:Lipocalin/cytosolic fatty-acid binding domain-containing protein n=1 Tax=Opisthorchis felineus TaxID=147828 RepID=A0A4S2ME98_OPIFE|nr:hypothetical protein CRM22_000665 [Opisthorchis felineus]
MKTTLFHILFTLLVSNSLCHEREIVIAQWAKPRRGDEPGGFTCEDLKQGAPRFWKKRQFYDCQEVGSWENIYFIKFKTDVDIWRRDYREIGEGEILWLANRMVNDYRGSCRTVSEFFEDDGTNPTHTIMLTGLYQETFCKQLMKRQFDAYQVTSCDVAELGEHRLQLIYLSTYQVQLNVPAERDVVLDLVVQLNNGLSKCRYNAYAVRENAH